MNLIYCRYFFDYDCSNTWDYKQDLILEFENVFLKKTIISIGKVLFQEGNTIIGYKGIGGVMTICVSKEQKEFHTTKDSKKLYSKLKKDFDNTKDVKVNFSPKKNTFVFSLHVPIGNDDIVLYNVFNDWNYLRKLTLYFEHYILDKTMY